MSENHKKTNVELLADPQFKAALESGKVVVIQNGFDTKNPDIKQACLAQLREDVSTAVAQEGIEARILLLGWRGNNVQILRDFVSYKPSVKDLKIGDTLPEGFHMKLTVKDEPFPGTDGKPFVKRDGSAQTPWARPDGSIIMSKDGKYLYRDVTLVYGTKGKDWNHDFSAIQDAEGNFTYKRVSQVAATAQVETEFSDKK